MMLRRKGIRVFATRRAALPALAFVSALATLAPTETQNAIANGDTRTLTIYHSHTHETLTATFRVNGSYDSAALQKLNWALRDWRLDEATKMDPRLFDVLWEVYRTVGSHQPIKIMSAYRSARTNAMLRRRSRAVAEHSQHILGKAMDVHFQDVSAARAREAGMRLQRGGVGYYPSANSPFVHLDVGSVRHWPRMTYDQLARLFPDGKTVHIPSNGQPLPGYQVALAEIEARGGSAYGSDYVTTGNTKGLLAFLFGSREEEEDVAAAPAAGSRRGGRRVASAGRSPGSERITQAMGPSGDDVGSRTFFVAQANTTPQSAEPVSRAMRNLPRGQTTASPAPAAPAKPAETLVAEARKSPDKPTVVAAAEPAETTDRAREARETGGARLVDAPLPPRRPSAAIFAELGFSDVPLPPTKPVEIAALSTGPKSDAVALAAAPEKPDPIARKIAEAGGAGLPKIITGGAARPAQANVMAFASEPAFAPRRPEVLRRQPQTARAPAAVAAPAPSATPAAPVRIAALDLVAARVDRSNFRALTSAVPTDRVATQTTLGASALALRPAGKDEMTALVLRSLADSPTTFAEKPVDAPSAVRFEGPAKPR